LTIITIISIITPLTPAEELMGSDVVVGLSFNGTTVSVSLKGVAKRIINPKRGGQTIHGPGGA
jgi:hypothetical protein